jgi:hypothetical protein
MSSQFVGSREALRAAGELAGVRLFAGMCANMSGLMFQSVKGLLAQGAFVGSGEILSVVAMLAHHVGHHTDGRHLCLSLLFLDLGQLSPGSFLLPLQRRLWIQQTIKIYRRICALHVIAAAANAGESHSNFLPAATLPQSKMRCRCEEEK